VLVAFWPTKKPVYVPLDGYVKLAKGRRYLDREWIRKGKHGAILTAPEPYTEEGGWSRKLGDKYKAELARIMKEEMKGWPRDEKGRWVKKT
jgi:hypothetical protein